METDINAIRNSKLVQQSFAYWFADHEHIRSPFPDYIQEKLREKTSDLFADWVRQLDPKAKDEIDDSTIGEKLEEILFEASINMVRTEDEKITILYPFLPRIGDQVQNGNLEKVTGCSIIKSRILAKEGDISYLKVMLESMDTKGQWETRFELPV